MRRLKTTVLAVVPALVVALAGLLNSSPVQAASAGYAASDVLGQLDGSGNPDFTTNDPGTSATTLDYPAGTALDSVHHRLFVIDDANRRVVIHNLDQNNNLVDHTADNVIGQADFTSKATGTSQSTFRQPYEGVTYDSLNDRLFVSDFSNNRVLIYNLSGGIVDGMNADYVLGQSDFTHQVVGHNQNGLSRPEGLAIDAAHNLLFTADELNNRVLVFDINPATISNGENASYVLGQPDFVTTTATTTQNGMRRPEAMAYNSVTQQLFVGDSVNNRILIFNLAGGIVNGMNADYELGQPDFTTNNFTTANAHGMGGGQEGLAIDTSRNILYETDDSYNRMLVFNLSGGITSDMDASMVVGQVDFTSDDYSCPTPTTATIICDPEGALTIDAVNNRVYLLDSASNRVLIFNFAKLASDVNDPAVGDSYSQWMGSQFQGTPTFSVTAGSLPPGLSLDPSSGLLSGTFTQAGTFNFTIQLVDNNGSSGNFTDTHSYSLVVDPVVAAAGAAAELTDTGLKLVGSALMATGLMTLAVLIYSRRQRLYRLYR